MMAMAVLALLVAASLATAASAEWCAGAYDEKQGSNFGTCVGR